MPRVRSGIYVDCSPAWDWERGVPAGKGRTDLGPWLKDGNRRREVRETGRWPRKATPWSDAWRRQICRCAPTSDGQSFHGSSTPGSVRGDRAVGRTGPTRRRAGCSSFKTSWPFLHFGHRVAIRWVWRQVRARPAHDGPRSTGAPSMPVSGRRPIQEWGDFGPNKVPYLQ